MMQHILTCKETIVEKQPIFQYFKVGFYLQDIRHVQSIHFQEVCKSFLGLKQVIKDFGFVQAESIVALLEPLCTTKTTQSRETALKIEQLAETMEVSLETETKDRFLIEVNRHVSPRLIDLRQRRQLTSSQGHLWEETIRCLERQAYRASIVMGWALAYDVIRWSVWNDLKRRSQLIESWKGRSKIEDVDYDDFINSTTGEFEFLESCRAGGLLGDKSRKMFDRLVAQLRERNDYAHANEKTPTPNIANAYVDKLLDIIDEKPFC